jgi:hypothetical protein
MDLSTFFGSVTGIVIVAIIFAVPILSIIAVLAIILAVVNRRHRERMKMIEQGMMPAPPPKRTGNYYPLLIVGSIFTAFGLALLGAALASHDGDLEGGFIFGFIGIAQIVCFVIIRMIRRHENAGLPPANGNGQPGN